MKTITEVDIEGVVVEIKSRRDTSHVSGWSVIAFTPSCSIRSVKTHRPDFLDDFARAIVASVYDGMRYEEFAQEVAEAVKSIID
jgi:hypothetical protein